MMEQANTGMVGHDATEPLSTIVGKGSTQRLLTANLVVNTTGHGPKGADEPLATVTTGDHHVLTTATLEAQGGQDTHPTNEEVFAALVSNFRTSNTAGGNGDVARPLNALTAGGTHAGLVECKLSEEATAGAERVAAFMMKFYKEGGQWAACNEPMHTITAKDRLALVTVRIRGKTYVIVDIGLRMLTPAELFRAQGFPKSYVFEQGADGERITKTDQVRLCGNSVCPPVAEALVRANLDVIRERISELRMAA